MNILNALRQTVKGGSVIADWIGAGGLPVPQDVADSRASACLTGNGGKSCPFNTAPKWWEYSKGSIAQAIRDMLSVKNEIAMEVKGEDQLHMCRQCGCCLRLKVWAPMSHVRKVLDQETVSKLPAYCWMKRELAKQ